MGVCRLETLLSNTFRGFWGARHPNALHATPYEDFVCGASRSPLSNTHDSSACGALETLQSNGAVRRPPVGVFFSDPLRRLA